MPLELVVLGLSAAAAGSAALHIAAESEGHASLVSSLALWYPVWPLNVRFPYLERTSFNESPDWCGAAFGAKPCTGAGFEPITVPSWIVLFGGKPRTTGAARHRGVKLLEGGLQEAPVRGSKLCPVYLSVCAVSVMSRSWELRKPP